MYCCLLKGAGSNVRALWNAIEMGNTLDALNSASLKNVNIRGAPTEAGNGMCYINSRENVLLQ